MKCTTRFSDVKQMAITAHTSHTFMNSLSVLSQVGVGGVIFVAMCFVKVKKTQFGV
jgi:hypothetical protein